MRFLYEVMGVVLPETIKVKKSIYDILARIAM